MERICVVGAGTMGHGIAQACAAAGLRVTLADREVALARAGRDKVAGVLARLVEKGKSTAEAAADVLARIDVSEPAEAMRAADLVIEAVPERVDLKAAVLRQAAERAPAHAWLATNTSSLSIDGLASHLPDPARLVGAHFFNPVPVMALLEVVEGPRTAPEAVAAIRALGARIGKECIVVRDAPGFATSRLGVCLGMEAIRMVEQGVASAEDIDKAMVLGYRHPVGPLRLTDLVGLDVRLAIGAHLASALGNPAFEPPALLRRLVAEGKLGQKSGEGFYRW
jgi:3-hydroxybutyryl-CoA dehydrogenase